MSFWIQQVPTKIYDPQSLSYAQLAIFHTAHSNRNTTVTARREKGESQWRRNEEMSEKGKMTNSVRLALCSSALASWQCEVFAWLLLHRKDKQ